MLDVNKLLEQNKLAKELVDKGIAKNMDEANQMIEKNKMISRNDGYSDLIVNSKKKAEPQASSSSHNNNSQLNQSESCCVELKEKIKQLNEKIRHSDEVISKLINFFNDYKAMNDSNLKEVDERLKSLESMPRQQAASEQKELKSNVNKNSDHDDRSKYSVENIFNNSHGRLLSK